MGAVFEAEDSTLGRAVALKVLDVPDESGELAGRLLREARILARLEHPGIVPVHDVGTLADGRVFYTMKLVGGQRLDHYIEEVQALPDRLRIFQRICEAVAFAHARGVLHRDLKPQNVMVGAFGEVLVMDWGVAKILRDKLQADSETAESTVAAVSTGTAPRQTPATAHGAILGTPGYMAPEQARGETESLDERADVYALGALLRFLLTGRNPEEATTLGPPSHTAVQLRETNHGRESRTVPKPLAAICAMAMADAPEARYPAARDMVADVARYLDGLPVTAYPEVIWQKAGRLFSKHRLAVLLILTYLLARGFMLLFLGR